MKHRAWIGLLVGGLLAVTAMAGVEVREFDSPAERARFNALVAELRCPKCQNQNLANSNAPIARDLRDEVHRLMRAGRSDEAIKAHLVGRYGRFVLYRPPWHGPTLWLWLAPAVFLLLGVVLLWRVWRRLPPLNDGDAPEEPPS